MSNTTVEKVNSKIKENKCHQHTLKCLKECSNFILLITSHQKNCKDYSYFSKLLSANNNNIIFINNISSQEIINNIFEFSINNNKNFLNSYNFELLFLKFNNNIEQITKEIIKFPLDSEKLNLNFIDFSKNIDYYRNSQGLNLLIKYDLNESNGPIILDKKIIYNLLSFKINAKIHEANSLLDKDIFFLLEIKKILKSIQVKLEYLQKQEIKDLDNIELFFIPLLEYPNIGMIISVNPEFSPFNIGKIKTNFNSIVKYKFIIKSILIAINVSSLLKGNNLSLSDSNIKQIDNNKDIFNDNINEETTTASSINSPKITYHKFIGRQDYNCDYDLKLPLNNINNNEIYINNFLLYKYKNIFKNQYLKSYNSEGIKNININNKNIYYNNEIKENEFIYEQSYFNINKIIINSDNIFPKTLFNRYQDKSNSTCNLKILIEFLQIKTKKPLNVLTLIDFFSSFSKISALSLKIPFFNKDGNIIYTTLTPFLQEIKLLIKSPKFIKRILKKLKLNKIAPEKNNSLNELLKDEENNIYKDYEGFEIGILENKTVLSITYKENKPYYLTDSLYDKLEHLMSLFKSLKKINIGKNVIINKSYIGIGWNIINTINMLSSSFVSYHLFNGNFIGILSNIKETEKNFWLNSIEEINNKPQVINYEYLISENYSKINNFIKDNNYNNIK